MADTKQTPDDEPRNGEGVETGDVESRPAANRGDEPATQDPVQPGSEQARRNDGADPLRVNNLDLGVPAPDGGPAPVRYPHQVPGLDERAVTPERPTDERTDEPALRETGAQDDEAETRAKRTPGTKR